MATVAALMAAKAEIARVGIEACDLVMDVAAAARPCFKESPIERAYRDIRGVKFHPLQREAILLHAAKLSLGLPWASSDRREHRLRAVFRLRCRGVGGRSGGHVRSPCRRRGAPPRCQRP
jgi:hypothetical protein